MLAAGVALLASAMWASARVGLSRFFSEYAAAAASVASAEKAIALNPGDPQGHYARAAAFADLDLPKEAAQAFERVITLKPRDYYLWLRAGRAHDWAGDEAAARRALGMAVRLAPFYAPPRWELGNVLLRAGEREQAFVELRRAAESNTTLLPAVIDLAWGAYEGDAAAVERLINPQTAETRLTLARYFMRRERLAETLALLAAADSEGARAERRVLLRELLARRRFAEARQVWLSERGGDPAASLSNVAAVSDGGFEGQLVRDIEAGFGWQWAGEDEAKAKAAIDPNGPRAGARSLRLEWSGDPRPALPVISQLVVVEPGQTYGVSFAARTGDLVSAGLPMVAVVDADDIHGPPLGVSPPLPRDTGGWRDYTFEFAARETTRAVIVFLRRQCAVSPCPIYGRLWLDEFSIAAK